MSGLLYILSVVNLITTFAHALGAYLLTCLYIDGTNEASEMLLINLSISEASLNFLQFLINVLELAMIPGPIHYLRTLRGFGFIGAYFCSMVYITMDKLLDILLNSKYHVYVTNKRVKILLG